MPAPSALLPAALPPHVGAPAAPAAAAVATAETAGGGGGGGGEYSLRWFSMQAGSEHVSKKKEQETALRHVVLRPTVACGDELTFVDLSDVDVQRVAREAVASANERRGTALLLISVLEAQVVVPGYREYTLTLLAADNTTRMAAHYATHALDLGQTNNSDATPETSQGANTSGAASGECEWEEFGECDVVCGGAGDAAECNGGSSAFNSSNSGSGGGGVVEWDLARAMAGVCVDEGWVLIPAAATADKSTTPTVSFNTSIIAPYTDAYNGLSIRSLALFGLDQLNRNSSLSSSNVTLQDVLAARANVVEGAGINYSVTVIATKTKAADKKEAGKQVVVVKVVVWQPVPFTAFQPVDFFRLDGGDGEGGSEKQEGLLLSDCAYPPPLGYVLLANCTQVPKTGFSVAAPMGFVTWFRVLLSLGLVLALM
ncbi:unnamed protein product [Closterium sp. Yama58-4]|nr:unnamed protein product [Closterium sp. Yama58-4]